ncbi:hypothetical protein SUGI_0323850 [Cryptomeria japonica]|uniref:auxin transport protein BIG n=1 Tax=Cryptomeria japonica TaxID=3369 RepID=UPI002408B9B6|nr:auxin transport protein BIG [Cryptomeria japonica]GLJ18302.1 hypothetical protein SUGI_0323850 [Cryptomeria japonica]
MAIGEVLEILQRKDGLADLRQRLHEGAVHEGLKHLALVLAEGSHGTAGLSSWSSSQIQGAVSVTQAVVAACCSLRDDDEKSLVARIFELAVEFCLCYLKNNALIWPAPDEQASLLVLLEMTVIDGRAREVATTLRPLQNLQEFLTLAYSDSSSERLSKTIEYMPQGCMLPKQGKSMGKVMAILTNESPLFDGEQPIDLQESSFWKVNSNMISVSQHHAVIHLGSMVHMVVLCRDLMHSLQLVEENSEEKVLSRIMLITKLLKVLLSLAKATPFTVSSNQLLVNISEMADLLPGVFKLRFEASNCDLMNAENNLDHLLPLMLETFFQFVHSVVLDDNIFENIRTFIIAALLDTLDGGMWRLDRPNTVQQLPLVYKPQVFIKILRFIRDVRLQSHRNIYWKETNHGDQSGDKERADIISVALCCHLRSEIFSLIGERSKEEQINVIFSSAGPWLDNLVSLASFLHFQGVKPRPKGDKSWSSCSKDGAAVNDAESVSGHEDDALFGDLFSEASKQVVCDGHEQPCSTNETLSDCSNMPLHGATEVLRFLKECIFSQEWHSSVFEKARHQLTKEHVSVLLSLLQSQAASSDGRMEGSDPSEISFQRHLVGHFYKACFDLLHELVTRHSLSNELEEHLVDQVLKVEDGRYAYTDDALALLAHILIIRASKRSNLGEDPLRLKICKGYVDFIVEKVNILYTRCLNVREVSASLPYLFHLEILLMVYHSSSACEKTKMAEITFLALSNVSSPPAEFNNTQLACWSLLVSRLMLVIRHMIRYFTTFPSWLMLHMRNKLRQGSQGEDLHLFKGVGHLESWVYHVVQNVINLNEGISGEQGMDDLSFQLIDVSGFCNSSIIEYNVLQDLGLDWTGLYSVISCILEAWQGKTPSQVEELILERYCFILGWSTLSDVGFKDASVLPWKAEPEGKLLGTECFIHFSRVLRHNINLAHCGELSQLTSVLLEVLSKQQTLHKQCNLNEKGWVFLRHGAWLSLVISLLEAGLWKVSQGKRDVSRDDMPWIEQTYKDTAFLTLCEQLISHILEEGQTSLLLNILTSFLSMYVGALQNAALVVLDGKQCENDTLFSLNLLLKTGLDKSKEEAILEKLGARFELIKSIYATVSSLGRLVNQENTGNLNKVFLSSLLHGFPSHGHPGSAVLVSAILSVEGILDTIEEFLRTRDELGEAGMEAEVLNSLIEITMTMKFDRRFEGIHDKCEVLLNYLIPKNEERHIYTDLFLIKHMEGLVNEMNSKEINLAVRENLITNAVDTVECLRVDPSKLDVLKYYLGHAGESDTLSQLKLRNFLGEHGNLLALVDSLDGCHSESVNVKVLQLFVNFLTDDPSYFNIKQDLQQKFLLMDLPTLAEWLEKRLLGYTIISPSGIASTHGIANSVRDSAIAFINALVLPSSHLKSRELLDHFLDAMLISLEKAFVSFDIPSAKAYFNFVVQLANGEPAIKQVVKGAINMMVKLSACEIQLEGLKFIFGFLISVLAAFGANKHVLEKLTEKPWSNTSCSSGSAICKLKSNVTKKNTDALVNPINQGAQSAAMECDATSADEDEDDGTSDGELASMDKEDDDDSNSERSLASKVCTFTSSGSNFMEQHWYFCYTCDLTVSKGCCSICARVCHRGHRVVYSRLSRFFCDCGAGGVRGTSCLCLKPRKFVSSSTVSSRGASSVEPFLPLPEDRDHLQPSDSDTDFDDDGFMDNEKAFKLSIPKEEEERVLSLFTDLDIEDHVLSLCKQLLPCLSVGCDSVLPNDQRIVLGEDKVLSYNLDLLQLKKAYKSGSFEMKIKAEYSNARELKSHLSSGSLVKSLLTISSRGRLAAGEGDKVTIFDVGQLIGEPTVVPVTVDKTNVKHLSKNAVRFELVHLVFNPATENYLAVAGYEECQVLTINPRGEVTDRLAIELALQGAYIRRVAWIPGSQVQLMVVTNKFVKVYDLSQDNISPMHYFTLLEESIVDAELVPISQGRLVLLVLSQHGLLYRQLIEVGGCTGAQVLVDTIQLQDRDVQSKGISLYFSSAYRLIFISYQDGSTLIGRLNPEAMAIMEVSTVLEDDQDGKLKPAGIHHWKELLNGSGYFVCLSTLKSNAPLAVSIGPTELCAQQLRLSGNSSSSWVGVAAYRPLSKDKSSVLVLHDDGSLQIFSFGDIGTWGSETHSSVISPEQVKKLGSGILNNRANAGVNPEFPLDFFEKTTCITADIKLGGDGIRNSDSEGAKLNLASDDGFLEGPSSSGFKVTVYNSNPDIVMVGCRVQVGNTSASHIPRELGIFQRAVKLEEGMRCWYDMPFTNAEALLADEEFTLTIGPTFNGSSLPRIDSLEIYGRAKDDFGWKEKVDAVLDIDTQTLSGTSGSIAGRKHRSMQTASIQEQVVADGLKLLSGYYSLYRLLSVISEESGLESSKRNSQSLLEVIFQTDRQQILQSAGRQVLQALYPVKETYYQVKDMMRLSGVVRTCPVLTSKIGIGGATTAWVIQEFAAQMQAVCKIALHRRPNLAAFLDSNGSAVVDGLMEILWRILELEQPDTQTINNIVIPAVDLIYSYAECLALHGNDSAATGSTVAPAVALLKRLLFAPYEAVQTSCSLAMSSRLLQVPFPKQTMLATDDVTENNRSLPAPSDTSGATGGSVHGMIEEDTNTSSVQYCCDGCSTVPILRRRWHCNVCPDFDLCEACYEVMDSDRLPQPHMRDHPMSAIPIEVDSVAADGSEIQFSMDEMSEESLLQVATEISLHNSPPLDPPMETNGSRDFLVTANDTKVVALSAAKRAVNSLLLSELMEEIKGWMKSTPGSRAIPLMQLFYRLASAVGGPFMENLTPESLDLEKFVKMMLDELNLSTHFVAKIRSSFGEVLILIFMFFTLMLRNWHQPGSDQSLSKTGAGTDTQDSAIAQGTPPSSGLGSPSSNDDPEKSEFVSQLERACTVLRQQHFINYLMDILQQLVHVFKTPRNLESGPTVTSGAACGALLTIRREFPAGNFVPYFSDSYAKAHRNDLFVDFHRLLLENTFRLVYNLIRPEKPDRPTERSEFAYKGSVNRDLKLDGWQEVLCSYISNPHTAFVRRYARRLFLHLCGSRSHYYNVRDSWQISREFKRIYKLVNKSGGFQTSVPYERSVKLVKCLSAVNEVASARPRNWQRYCSRHIDVLQFLLSGVFFFGEESVLQTLKLLTLSFYTGKELGQSHQKLEVSEAITTSNKSVSQASDGKKKKKGDEGTDTGIEKSSLDMEQAVEQFSADDGKVLRRFIDSFLLEWNSTSIRVEAKSVLLGTWHHGKQSFRGLLLTSLLEKVSVLPSYGQNIVEYTELLTWLLGKRTQEHSGNSQEAELVQASTTGGVVKSIFDTLRSQNELLANHPNCRIYNTLSSLVEFDGYYLESEPCVTCSCPEVPYSRMKLDSLKSETKFTDNRIIVKCTGSHTIQSVTMNVHDPRRSKSVKVLNLYYNNRPVADLSELKNNWSLWKRGKSCHLTFNQIELKVEFPIPITACNFMIELDSFYENLQASSLESLQCPRCSRYVTDKHGICGNCHENAYQCRQCRNINYENLDSFLCNECGYSKYGRFEFTFMAKPSFTFDDMENDEDMKKGLAAIEAESENAHRRYQQLLGFKKPLLKLVSSIGESEMDSQQKDSVQQLMVSLPGSSSFKINRKIALLGVLYGEKCKAAFDSVSRSVQTLQGLRRVLMNYLEQKHSDNAITSSRYLSVRPPNRCYGCATTFVTQCLELLQVLSKHPHCKQQLVTAGILSELFENNIHQGPKSARLQARSVLCSFSQGDATAVAELNNLIKKKVMYCLEHHRSMDIAACIREELQLLSETCSVSDELWEARLRIAFHLLFSSIKVGARHPAIAEHIILPCLRIISHACTPPKTESSNKEMVSVKAGVNAEMRIDETDKNASSPLNSSINGSKSQSGLSERDLERDARTRDVQLLNYAEWEKGASYLDFVRRQYKVSQSMKTSFHKSRRDSKRSDYLALKYALRWKRRACMVSLTNEFSAFEQSSWVSELVLSACSQSIRSEMCGLISVLCASSARRTRFLNLLMTLLPATKSAGESAAELFELLFKMVEPEDARLYLTVRGFLSTICRLITEEVARIEAQERSFHMDISQGFILHKLIELLSKFLEVPNIRSRFMRDRFLSQILEALLVTRGLIVQKTKLISDCNRLLRELLDCLLNESDENKRHFIWACISGLQIHCQERKGRTILFILEQLCNIICPSKPEPVYLLILSKAHTQEEFIRGSMTKNPYSSAEIGPLMRDVKNKICHQLDLLGLLEDDYGMELLVAGNIISLDLSIAQVYEQVWRKTHNQATNSVAGSGVLSVSGAATSRDCPPMTVTYRLQGLDGEATEPMIKELEEDREISQDPEIEFAIAGAVREHGGLDIILNMVQHLRDDELKSNQEELALVLKLLMYCCKIRDNRQALLRLGALALLLETARRAFSVDAVEPAEGILLIVESLVMEANDSDIGITESALTTSNDANCAGEQAAKVVMMFLERLCHPSGLRKSNKQQRNNEMVARILPYLTYGEQAAMEVLVEHFNPYLKDWIAFDDVQVRHQENVKDEGLAQQAAEQRFAVENFVKVSESIKINSFGEKLKDIIIEKGIAGVAVQHLKEVFGVFERGDFKSSPEWMHALKLPSVPVILSMLRGLARGHLAMQQCIDGGGVLPLLHALEGVSGENEIGARAENLLDTFADKDNKGEGFLADKVHQLRHATKDEMRRRALRKREELLQGLGMRRELASDGGERIVVSQPVIEGLEEVEEEEAGLACMVCREGYSLRPTDMLGAYSFSKRVHLGIGTTSHPRGEWVYTTVSHFNIIHFQCHQEAKRADASLKNPKKEWEGAALRNNETLCNSLFPLRGPAVPVTQYARHVDQYWDSLNALGRADGSRIRLLTYDIVLMLARFATGASFSTDSKGGGKESNSRLLPFMIQMANHLLDQGGMNQRRSMAKNLISYLTSPSQLDSPSGPKPSTPPSQRYGAAEETVQFMMVHSLLLQSLDEWEQHRHSFLQRGIYHAYMQYKHGRSPLTAPASSRASSSELAAMDPKYDDSGKDDANSSETGIEKLFAIVQPMLIYTGLIEQLQRFLKLNRPSTRKSRNVGTEMDGNEKANDDSSGSLSMELWEVTMRERLQDVKGMLGFSKELLNWLEDMQSASDMQEAFDIMGALSDALSGGFSRCEDFVQDAISNGNAK